MTTMIARGRLVPKKACVVLERHKSLEIESSNPLNVNLMLDVISKRKLRSSDHVDFRLVHHSPLETSRSTSLGRLR